jgi:hypothetical protein
MTCAKAFPRFPSGCRPSCAISFAGPMARDNLGANPKQPSPEKMPRQNARQPDHQQDDHEGQHDDQHDEQQNQAHDDENARSSGLR